MVYEVIEDKFNRIFDDRPGVVPVPALHLVLHRTPVSVIAIQLIMDGNPPVFLSLMPPIEHTFVAPDDDPDTLDCALSPTGFCRWREFRSPLFFPHTEGLLRVIRDLSPALQSGEMGLSEMLHLSLQAVALPLYDRAETDRVLPEIARILKMEIGEPYEPG